LLNKLTPTNFDELIIDKETAKKGEWFTLQPDIETHSDDIVKVIFEKAVEEPTFCELYRFVRHLHVFHSQMRFCSLLCKAQVHHDLKTNENTENVNKSKFRDALLNHCRHCFMSSTNENKKLESLREEIEKAKAVNKVRLYHLNLFYN
jgi:hypothetical protein